MWIVFQCRFNKTLSPEEVAAQEEEAAIQELLGKSYSKKTVSYVYDPLIQRIDNIVAYNHYDDEHISLRTKLGEVFIVKGSTQGLMDIIEEPIKYL